MKLAEQLRVRVPAEVMTALEARAKELDRSVGWVVREALKAYFEKEKSDG